MADKLASVPPPPPPPSTRPRPRVHSPPRPQHAAKPIPPEDPPVQETDGSSQASNDQSEHATTPPMQNGSQFRPSQDGTGHELSDGDEEKKNLPVQETDPAPQALGQQTSESGVPNEANDQTGENGQEHLP